MLATQQVKQLLDELLETYPINKTFKIQEPKHLYQLPQILDDTGPSIIEYEYSQVELLDHFTQIRYIVWAVRGPDGYLDTTLPIVPVGPIPQQEIDLLVARYDKELA